MPRPSERSIRRVLWGCLASAGRSWQARVAAVDRKTACSRAGMFPTSRPYRTGPISMPSRRCDPHSVLPRARLVPCGTHQNPLAQAASTRSEADERQGGGAIKKGEGQITGQGPFIVLCTVRGGWGRSSLARFAILGQHRAATSYLPPWSGSGGVAHWNEMRACVMFNLRGPVDVMNRG